MELISAFQIRGVGLPCYTKLKRPVVSKYSKPQPLITLSDKYFIVVCRLVVLQGAMLEGTWCGKDKTTSPIHGGFVLVCILSDISDNQPANCISYTTVPR